MLLIRSEKQGRNWLRFPLSLARHCHPHSTCLVTCSRQGLPPETCGICPPGCVRSGYFHTEHASLARSRTRGAWPPSPVNLPASEESHVHEALPGAAERGGASCIFLLAKDTSSKWEPRQAVATRRPLS